MNRTMHLHRCTVVSFAISIAAVMTGCASSSPNADEPLPEVSTTSAALVDPADLAVGGHHACVILRPGGAVKCWGFNVYGQLGLGDTATRGDNPGEIAALTALAH